MKRIAMVSGVCVVCMFTGCILDNDLDKPPALSVQLTNLSYLIGDVTSCSDKTDVLNKWLSEHGDSIGKDLESFKNECIPGADFRCMSHQILASGRVEVALKPCLEESTVRDGVERLNGIAGTAIGL